MILPHALGVGATGLQLFFCFRSLLPAYSLLDFLRHQSIFQLVEDEVDLATVVLEAGNMLVHLPELHDVMFIEVPPDNHLQLVVELVEVVFSVVEQVLHLAGERRVVLVTGVGFVAGRLGGNVEEVAVAIAAARHSNNNIN